MGSRSVSADLGHLATVSSIDHSVFGEKKCNFTNDHIRCRLPIAAVGSDCNRISNSGDMIDTFRAILQNHDFESTCSEIDGGSVLANLAFNTCRVVESSAMPILWLLQNFCTYLPLDRRTTYYLLGLVFDQELHPVQSEILSSLISFYTPAFKETFFVVPVDLLIA